ncbi:transposase [Burkholderia contaminans]|uniref:transposase n=1 Tax=Burkholderia contaminans TaxID=488447 RepID=UPI00069D5B0B
MKGNQWQCSTKTHIGVDADSGLVHSAVCMSANVSDVSQAHARLHGQETFRDTVYTSVDRCDDINGKTVKWRVAVKRGKIGAIGDIPLKNLLEV